MKLMAPQSVDCVVTSPPYNIGIDYSTYRDNLPRKQYLEWIASVGKEIARVMKPEGSFFLNVGNRPSDQWIAHDVIGALRDCFVLQNTFHWIKSITIDEADLSVGH